MLSISSRAEDILIGGASLKTIQDTVVLTESGKIEYKELAQLDPAFVRYLQCLPQPLSTAWGPFCELSHFVQEHGRCDGGCLLYGCMCGDERGILTRLR